MRWRGIRLVGPARRDAGKDMDEVAHRRLIRRCTMVAAGGLLSVVGTVVASSRPFTHPLLVGFFLVAVGAGYLRPLRLFHAEQAESFHFDEALFVPMALLLSPVEVVFVVGMATLIGQLGRRRPMLKICFNMGDFLLSAGLGLAAAHLLGVTRGFGARSVTAAFVGGLVYTGSSTVLVSWVVSLAQGLAFWEFIREGIFVRGATYIGSLSLGVLVLLATQRHHVVLGVAL